MSPLVLLSVCVTGTGWRGGSAGSPAWGSCMPSRLMGSRVPGSAAFCGVSGPAPFPFCCSCFCMLAVRIPIFFTLSYSVREGTPYFLLACRADMPGDRNSVNTNKWYILKRECY